MTTVKNVILKDAIGNYLIPYPANTYEARVSSLESGTEKLSNKNVANGYVGLDNNCLIPTELFDNTNVKLSTFLLSNALSAPSESWKGLGETVANSSYPDFYSDALSMYNTGNSYNVDYSLYTKTSECFVIDWLPDSITGESVATNKYRFVTDLFTATIQLSSGLTAATALTILKQFLGTWTTTSGRKTGYSTYSGTLDIEFMLNEPYRTYFDVTKFSRFIINGYSNSAQTERYSLTCKVDITQNGTTWTTAYNSGPGWNVVVNQKFKGLKLNVVSGGIEFGHYTHDEHTTKSVCYSNRYYYKPATMAIAPSTGYSTNVLNNVFRTKRGFVFQKDYTYSVATETTGPTIPSSGILNSNWMLNGYYDFTNLFNSVYKLNTTNQTVTLPTSATYNFVCAENSNLNLIDFYQMVLNTYMKKDYENATKPYVVYSTSSVILFSNGFCIQRGYYSYPSAAGSYSVTYPVALSSSYSPMVSYRDSRTSNLYSPHLTTYSNTGFTFYFNTYNANATQGIPWHAIGFASAETVETFKAQNKFS